ncbi:OmpA/MotB domain protein [Methylobacterium sp. 4-46]|uniref:OmpA family protein n=1 Tax=unclassified Methylobacterium TaxID=2615210 RepID=UPI000152EA9E|nr:MULTISPECIES: OmpA family protein [Methylobacterium]ACA15464.1 OmpA/MotB domain protein [Methylobacterium sp. 4-46]WFT81182.1 OmpA family protein [Methylobacterium nodulans]
MVAFPRRSPSGFGPLVALALLLGSGGARAQTVTEDDIVRALMPRPQTRSLTLVVPDRGGREEQVFLDSLRNRSSLSAAERDRLAALSSDKQSIALDIPFAYNSSKIGHGALAQVSALGASLARPELRDSTILIVGHTDGKGSDRGNQRLSERRARAVKDYIVRHYGVAAGNLIGVGFGKSHLKEAANPYAAANRRVTAVNMSAPQVASRN